MSDDIHNQQPLVNPQPFPDDESAKAKFEQKLRSFVPLAANVDRERIMFLAGQAAASRDVAQPSVKSPTPWYWPVSTAASLALSLGLFVLLVANRESPKDAATITNNGRGPIAVAPPASPQTQPLEPLPSFSEISFLRVREIALNDGVDALRSTAWSASPATTLKLRSTTWDE